MNFSTASLLQRRKSILFIHLTNSEPCTCGNVTMDYPPFEKEGQGRFSRWSLQRPS